MHISPELNIKQLILKRFICLIDWVYRHSVISLLSAVFYVWYKLRRKLILKRVKHGYKTERERKETRYWKNQYIDKIITSYKQLYNVQVLWSPYEIEYQVNYRIQMELVTGIGIIFSSKYWSWSQCINIVQLQKTCFE